MRRVISLILSIAMIASLATGLAITGFAGSQPSDSETGLTYTLDGDENATIAGVYLPSKIQPIYEIPSTIGGHPVIGIGESAFSSRNELQSITIPDSVKTIGYLAFNHCLNLNSVTIGSDVTSIDDSAFYNCTSLTSVTIKATTPPTLGGSSVFHEDYGDDDETQLSNLTAIYVPAGSVGAYKASWTDYADIITAIGPNPEDLFKYTTDSDSATITGFKQGVDVPANLVIPDTLGGITVTSIVGQAFRGHTELTRVTIPASVKEIGSQPFRDCISLTEIIVDANNADYKSDNGVLYSEDGTVLLCYPQGKLDESFVIPDSVTSIYQYAFRCCTGLKSVTIPASVIEMDYGVFFNCMGLTSVTVEATTPPQIPEYGDDIFYYDGGEEENCPLENLTIYVPALSVDTYKGTAGWSEYAEKIQAIVGPITINGVDIEEVKKSSYGIETLTLSGDGNTVTVDRLLKNSGDLTINIPTGKTLIVSGTNFENDGAYAIWCADNIGITGGGTLEINAEIKNTNQKGISSYDDIYVTDCNIIVFASGTGKFFDGIYAHDIYFEKSSIKVDTDVADGFAGIYASGKITISGSNVETIARNGGYAIFNGNNKYDINIVNGSIVTATSINSLCIYSGKDVNIQNSNVTAVSNNNFGIFTNSGYVNISSTDSSVRARGGNNVAIGAKYGITVDDTVISSTNYKKYFRNENGNGITFSFGGTPNVYQLVATNAADFVCLREAPAKLLFNGTTVKVSGVDTFTYSTDGNTFFAEVDSLVIEPDNFYTISSTNGTAYINYVIKDITIKPEIDSLEEAEGTANALRDILSSTNDANTSNYALDDSWNGKVVVSKAAYNAFDGAINTAKKLITSYTSAGSDDDKPTQMTLDEALVNLNKAQVAFLNSLRANTHYKNGNGISYTDLDAEFSQYFEMTSVSANRTSGSDTYYAESVTLRYSPTNYSIHYTIYKDSNDESMIRQMIANETPSVDPQTPPVDPQPSHEDPKPIKVSQNNGKFNIQNILGSGYNIHSIYYTLGTSTDDKDYFGYIYKTNNPLSEVPVLGNGVHIFKIYATKNGVTSTYSMEVDVDYTDPVAVKQNGVVFINFENVPSKIYYTDEDGETVYVPIEKGLKLDAAKFDGITEIYFDTEKVTIK